MAVHWHGYIVSFHVAVENANSLHESDISINVVKEQYKHVYTNTNANTS